MNQKPLVSVIMNCYNGQQFLNEALDSLVEQTYIEVDNEVMFIRKITGNTLLVNRAQYSSIIDIHNSGAGISAINAQDDELLEFNLGDDFGFSENRFSFNDGKKFSPTKGVDV